MVFPYGKDLDTGVSKAGFRTFVGLNRLMKRSKRSQTVFSLKSKSSSLILLNPIYPFVFMAIFIIRSGRRRGPQPTHTCGVELYNGRIEGNFLRHCMIIP